MQNVSVVAVDPCMSRGWLPDALEQELLQLVLQNSLFLWKTLLYLFYVFINQIYIPLQKQRLLVAHKNKHSYST